MRLDDFKLSVVGMQLDDRLYLNESGEFLPIVDYEVVEDKCYLKVGVVTDDALTLSFFQSLDGPLFLFGLDDLQNVVPIYGYRVVDDRLILG